MEYIYQKSLYQFLKKEEINKIFINKYLKENKELEIDDDILNFFLKNLKKICKISKNKIFGDEEKKFEDFFKKSKGKNLKISEDKLENLLKEIY